MQESNTGEKLGKAFRNLCWLLTLLFTSLRACGVNDWNWYWVISPLLIYCGVQIIALIFLGFVKIGESAKGNKSDEDNHKPR